MFLWKRENIINEDIYKIIFKIFMGSPFWLIYQLSFALLYQTNSDLYIEKFVF